MKRMSSSPTKTLTKRRSDPSSSQRRSRVGSRAQKVELRLELIEPRRDDHRRRRALDDVLDRLQTVARDEGDRALVRTHDTLFAQTLERCDDDAAGRLREDTFGAREQADTVDDLLVADVFDRAARVARRLYRVIPVGGVADRERLGDRVRLHRTDVIAARLEGGRHRRAAGGLGAGDPRGVAVEESDAHELV